MSPDDPRNNYWRKAWRWMHSPLVLLPVVSFCTAFTVADMPSTVAEHGHFLGAAVGLALLAGATIAVVDLVPHAARWIVVGCTKLKDSLDVLKPKLQSLYERIQNITSE